MSLTSIIKAHSEIRSHIPNLKSRLRHLNGQLWDAKAWKTPIVVPGIGLDHEASKVGTALDYVIRAMLAHRVGDANIERRKTIAESALLKLPRVLNNADAALAFEKDPVIYAERSEGVQLARKHTQELLTSIEEQLDLALAVMVEYIQTGTNLESLILKTLFLSEMDFVFRTRSLTVLDTFLQHKTGKTFFSQRRTVSDEELAANVMQLAAVFEKSFHDVPMHSVLLNPSFGEFSRRVGGADADFVFDGTLIDIKTTMKLAYSTEDMAQIIGYAAMSRAIGKPVENAGIYFARFGLCAIFSLSELESSDLFLDEYLAELLKAGED